MALPLPHPSALLHLTRNAVGQAAGAATTLTGLPARAFEVLDATEALVRRIATVLDRVESVLERVESTLDRTGQIVDATEATIEQVGSVTARAGAPIDEAARITSAAGLVVADAKLVADRAAATMARAEGTMARAEGTMATVDELLAAYADTLRKGAPMANRFVEQLTPEEVDAAIRLIDELPRLTGHLTSDVLPILATLDRVGPDVHDLLTVTRDLKLAIAGIPGLAMLRRRGEALSVEEKPPAVT